MEMPVPLEFGTMRSPDARPVRLVAAGDIASAGLSDRELNWAKATGFEASAARLLALPGDDGGISSCLFVAGTGDMAMLEFAALSRSLPDGAWYVDGHAAVPTQAAVGLLLGSYEFTRYRKGKPRHASLAVPPGADFDRARRIANGVFLARDLINTPTSDMGPDDLETAVRTLAAAHQGTVEVIAGDGLLSAQLNMIHAVGRAASQAPRLIDLRWGRADAPKVTLVGKGVCFDTGGLDIKPASGMLLMKKDMGGAANVLGLASMVMSARLDIQLRVLIPAVENAISANAFRPGDVLVSRKGVTVEIGNTDAEGRLVLADALSLADEDEPELLIDMATLTGAARVALGPDLPPYYTDDDALADALEAAATAVADPMWRMPLWKPYMSKLGSKVADLNNVTTDGFAGSITAALFLQRFVEKTRSWVHFDIYGWNPVDRPWSPVGGEAQCIRAIEQLLVQRYASR